MTTNNADFDRILNATAFTASGDKLGKIGQLYLDDQSGEPTFVTVNTGLFGANESLVPLRGYQWKGEDLVLAYEKDVVKDAPNIDADGHLEADEQARLFDYYAGNAATGAAQDTDRTTAGVDRDVDGRHDENLNNHSEQPLAGGVDADRTAAGDRNVDADADRTAAGDRNVDANATRDAATDDVVAREERLNVGTTTEETGRVRLRKYTTTEQQQVEVPVTKEKVRIEREPIEGGRVVDGEINPNAEDEVIEVTTREERPVVSKETVETERVSLNKETVTENQTVSGEVSKEHIDVDQDGVS